MDDTDRVLRVTTPFFRPVFEVSDLAATELLDLTPTTAPGSTPGSPRRRLARGTAAPLMETLSLPVPALAVRLVDPPTSWGYHVRIDLARWRVEQAAVSGEITAPIIRIGRIGATPWGGLAAAAGALAIVLSATWMIASRGGSADGAAPPALAGAPQFIVTPLPADDELAAAPASDELEMPAAAATPPRPAPAPTHGVLMIGSKPPCRILVDGKDTGLTTPQRNVRVPSGRHTITLVNDEHAIEHVATLVITGGRKAKLIRDLSAQLARTP